MIQNLATLSDDDIERVERLTMRWLFQAVVDFGRDPFTIFERSPDDVKDVAEDVTREALDNLAGYRINERVFGTVDYKKARYIILPDATLRQALFVDSKAEKDRRTATLQLSQLSMRVRHKRAGMETDEPGALPQFHHFGGNQFLTTTMFLHFYYGERKPDSGYTLHTITLLALPNGRLQDKYNPTAEDTIFLAGRNAPTLGEDFRVRVSFRLLEAKDRWRVQRVTYPPAGGIEAAWQE